MPLNCGQSSPSAGPTADMNRKAKLNNLTDFAWYKRCVRFELAIIVHLLVLEELRLDKYNKT
jgi:hypothetical protein